MKLFLEEEPENCECLVMGTMRGILKARLNLFHTLISKGNRHYEISEYFKFFRYLWVFKRRCVIKCCPVYPP